MTKNTRVLFLFSILLSLPGLHSDALGQGTDAKRLTGTWNLDTSRSDDVRDAANRAVTNQGANSERMRQRLENRLQPPDRLSIEQSGRRITLASSTAPQVAFEADGRARTETNANGRTVQTSARLNGSVLTIRTQGDRASDFQVTFQPVDNGRSLQVIRRMYSDRMTQPIETKSFYTRVSDVAQLDVYSDSTPSTAIRRDNRRSNISDIPADTILTATLNESLNTRDAKDGDRFTLTVASPSQYSGAVIEGYLTRVERSGRVTGSPEIGFEFDSIRLRNGGTYDFSGYIEQVRTPTGDKVKVDNEGSVKEGSGQTQRTVVRTGIGAAIGAIIGGITGGGQGAAIGAAVGAGAGAGSVIVQGRDDLQLDSGTEFTIHTGSNTRISSTSFGR
jgi:outer membrane lipoprotein SlyB